MPLRHEIEVTAPFSPDGGKTWEGDGVHEGDVSRNHRRVLESLLLLILGGVALTAPTALGASGPDSARCVYDNAGVLEPAEIVDLESRADAIRRLGHPAVVYLVRKDASYEETVDDARGLMDAWGLQSGPGARDGVVMLINLKPSSPGHGTYAVVVGEALLEGSVPQRELDAIASAMRPALKRRKLGEAIALGLDRIGRDLREGPPPPPPPTPARQFAQEAAEGKASPMNVAAVALAALGVVLAIRWSPRRGKPPASSAAEPPSSLPPALAGALVNGSADRTGVAATILDLGKRGALIIEPEPQEKGAARIRLLDGSVAQPGFERELWRILSSRAEGNVVSSRAMAKLRSEWGSVEQEIERDLVNRGWFDPESPRKRRPLMLLALGLFLLTVIATILGLLARSPYAAIGIGALAGSLVVAFVSVSRVPTRTESGDQTAAPWLGYRRHIRNIGEHPETHLDIETAVPYAMAFGIGASLNKRLQRASESGELPSWLGPEPVPSPSGGGFYAYWIGFQSSMAPSGTSGGASGGASAGSGASGGSF